MWAPIYREVLMDTGVSRRWSDYGATRSQAPLNVKVRHEESVLCMVDALALRACRRGYPIRFGLVVREADRQAVSRLCASIAVTKTRGVSPDFPAWLEGEIDDTDALLLAGWEDDRAVAASRLVLPNPGRQLPTESAFDLWIEPRGRVVDAAWFVVAREHSSIEHRVLAGLVGRSWLEIRARGFSHVCASLSRCSMRVSERLGLKMIPLAPARGWLREERYPVVFDLVGAVPHLFARWATPTSDALFSGA